MRIHGQDGSDAHRASASVGLLSIIVSGDGLAAPGAASLKRDARGAVVTACLRAHHEDASVLRMEQDVLDISETASPMPAVRVMRERGANKHSRRAVANWQVNGRYVRGM